MFVLRKYNKKNIFHLRFRYNQEITVKNNKKKQLLNIAKYEK